MNGYKSYILYLALKAHFSRTNYDFFKFHGKVAADYDSFINRNDKYFFEKLSEHYPTKKRLLGFLLSNMLIDKHFYVGDFRNTVCEKIYYEWLGKIESLGYIFNQDLRKVLEECEKAGIDFRDFFRITSGELTSPFLEIVLEDKVNLETYIMVDKLLGLTEYYDGKILDPLYEEFAFKTKKYSPFIQLDRVKFAQIFEEFI